MPIFGWVLISLGGLLTLGIIVLLVAYALSPEGREASRVRQRMAANARHARREMHDRTYERTRDQLRAEQHDQPPTSP
jgi:hypothetical protein